jgi:hypothetical protein
MGAGTVKSAIYDATKQVLAEKTKMTPEQIEAAAIKAQEYGGENLDQILIGAGIGAIGARTGAEPVIARQLAKDIVGRSVKAEAGETAVKRAAVRDKTAKATALAAERGVVNKARSQPVRSLQPSSHKAVKNSLPRTWRCNAKDLTCPQCVVSSVRALWRDWLALVWAQLVVGEKVTQPSAMWLLVRPQTKAI